MDEIYKKIETYYKKENPEDYKKVKLNYEWTDKNISLSEYVAKHVENQLISAKYNKSLLLLQESKLKTGDEKYKYLLKAKQSIENSFDSNQIRNNADVKKLYEEIKQEIKKFKNIDTNNTKIENTIEYL